MILTNRAIQQAMEDGDIVIESPLAVAIQPNGIDYHLHHELLELDGPLDMRQPVAPQQHRIEIPVDGFVLQPGAFYLGLTVERVASSKYAQWLFGDRTMGSLGVFTQVSAPLGHVGSAIRWTLEITAIKPVRVYPEMKFGKICFLVNVGDIQHYGAPTFLGGKYTRDALTLSRLGED